MKSRKDIKGETKKDAQKVAEKARKKDIKEREGHSKPDHTPKRNRVKETIQGQNRLGSITGKILDVASIFLPDWAVKGRKVIQTKTQPAMPKRVKPYLTQLSTWEGIAAILGAIGVIIYPEAIVEIVIGVFTVIGGIEIWKKETEDD